MIGAGVFSAIGPAAGAAGNGLLLGLLLAAFVAFCNATSSAELAALYPQAGGTYVYGRRRLGPFLALPGGLGIRRREGRELLGDGADVRELRGRRPCAPARHRGGGSAGDGELLWRPEDGGANARDCGAGDRDAGGRRRGLLLGGQADADRLTPLVDDEHGLFGILQAAGLLFFAFAGYARIATLGEEVRDPARVIPKAIPIALGITLVIYTAVAVAALMAVGPNVLATADAPLVAAVEAGIWTGSRRWFGSGRRSPRGRAVVVAGGVSRTLFSMASNGDMPRALESVHPVHRAPDRARSPWRSP